eukprot:CAMPEP_0169298154 /NCGR_PEP_ID=MMETSP1016-20121227/66232_1 /TAXON_ID=342587 /ORGANISM="Karlodinium micrum, Strain CCMP2283" /LENGTH=103 /DNA_ID=CAMNT_0009390013 /DNA_START=281 /DNA_END=588 /DNA_ORIENTATION=+
MALEPPNQVLLRQLGPTLGLYAMVQLVSDDPRELAPQTLPIRIPRPRYTSLQTPSTKFATAGNLIRTAHSPLLRLVRKEYGYALALRAQARLALIFLLWVVVA